MQIQINPNIKNVKESATLAINMKVKQLRAEGQQVIHFGFGESPFPVPKAIQQALVRNSHRKAYLPTRGLPELLESVAAFYRDQCDLDVISDQICIGPGSKELIFQAIYLLEGPLLVPAPSWVSYGPQAALRGKELVAIATDRKHSYKLDPEALLAVCTELGEQQKILILNNPNNPTGARYEVDELAALAEVCRDNNVIVISDEIYGLVSFDRQACVSMAHYYPEATIVTSGLSKAFSAGGYRLGTMIVPKKMASLMHAIMAMVSETFSAVSAPIQYAAVTAFEFGPTVAADVNRYTEIHQTASRYLYRRFIAMGLECPKPMGAFYLFPDFEPFRAKLLKVGISSGEALAANLLDDFKLALLPGADFYMSPDNLGLRVASVDYDGESVAEQFPMGGPLTDADIDRLFPRLVEGCDRLDAFLNRLV